MRYFPFLFVAMIACSEQKAEQPNYSKLDKAIDKTDSLQKVLSLKLDTIHKYTKYRFKMDSFAILYYQTGEEKYRRAANRLIDSVNRYASKTKK